MMARATPRDWIASLRGPWIQRTLAREVGKPFFLNGICKLLNRHGVVFRKPRPEANTLTMHAVPQRSSQKTWHMPTRG